MALWLYAVRTTLRKVELRAAHRCIWIWIYSQLGFPPLMGGLPTGGKNGFFPAMLSPHSERLHKVEREV